MKKSRASTPARDESSQIDEIKRLGQSNVELWNENIALKRKIDWYKIAFITIAALAAWFSI